MKSTEYNLLRYDADEGYVFDWAQPRFDIDEEGNEIQQHLYAKTIYLGVNDSIDNYVEVETPVVEEE